MNHYVISLKQGFVEHEGNKESCNTFVRNAQSLFNTGPFLVVEGAANREAALKQVKNETRRFARR